jgi:hypothetical protein
LNHPGVKLKKPPSGGFLLGMKGEAMHPKLSKRLARWSEAWQSLDPERVGKVYAADAVHQSAAVKRLLPEKTDGRLAGREAIKELARAAAGRFSALRFEPLEATETEVASVFEYRRVTDNDEASAVKVCEVIFWRGDEVVESRVYHA